MKTIGGLRKTCYRGRARVQWHAYLVAAAYNLLRIARLGPPPPETARFMAVPLRTAQQKPSSIPLI